MVGSVATMVPLSVVVFSCLALAAATDVEQCPVSLSVNDVKAMDNGFLVNDTALDLSLIAVQDFLTGSRNVETLQSDVVLTPCKKLPCKLKKNTSEHISFKFTTDKEIKDLKNHVNAEVYGVPLPFIGVDGSSVCDKLQTETGEKASCPLEAGKTYVYKDSFPILSVYPTIAVKVHWALQTHGKDIACFEVPAKIVN